jgi:hypothetical protein
MNVRVFNRKLHRWGAAVAAAPLLVIVATGLLLQVKKQVAWVQPPEQRGSGGDPAVSWAAVLEACRGVPEAEIRTWADVQRLDVRPSRGLIKLTAANNWEVQLDAHTGTVLQVAYRRSDIIEALHDGSWFHDGAKLWLFLPAGAILLGLWLTGAYLFWLPYSIRWRRR